MIFPHKDIINIALSLAAFFTLTDRPETARWLTVEEKQLAVGRFLSERVGTTQSLDKIEKTKTIRGIFNLIVLSTSVILLLLINITVQGLAFFLPTVVRSIVPHKTVVHQQLLSVPPYIFGSVIVLTTCCTNWRLDRRNLFLTLGTCITIPGYVIFLATSNGHASCAATFLVAAGSFAFGALTQAQSSANVVSETARSAAIGITVGAGNIGGLISTWSYLPFDGPNYHVGNGLNLAANSAIFLGSILLELWMETNNRKRDARRECMVVRSGLEHSNEEKKIQDLDWTHPDFRWRP